MLGKTFLGPNVSDLDIGEQTMAISRVILKVDGETTYTAGDESGKTIEKDCIWGSQAMADKILASVSGVRYRPFTGTDGMLDLAAEVGDGITAGDMYSVLAQTDITFDRLCAADVSAPGASETTNEYTYKSRTQRQSERELARIRSSIIKTAESITLRVENEIKGLRGELTLTAESLTAEIENTREGLSSRLELTAQNFQVQITGLNNAYSSISQTVDSISLGVFNGQESSTITLYKNGIAVQSQNITFTGTVTVKDLDGSAGTIISGSAIQTDTLRLNALHGDYIYLYSDSMPHNPSAEFRIGNASSAYDRCELSARAILLDAWQGNLFLQSNSGAAIQVGGGYGTNVQIIGDLIPNATGWYSCGSSSFKWTDVYAMNGTIVTSDRERKEEIDYDVERYGRFFDALRPASYRLKEGTSGRTHLGLIAQDVEAALEESGLTDMDFAGFIRSPREGGGYDYALRYGEIIPLLIARQQKLTARVAKLERRIAE